MPSGQSGRLEGSYKHGALDLRFFEAFKVNYLCEMAGQFGIQEVFRGKDPVVEYGVFILRLPILTKPSIIAVHGLNGGPTKTWTTKKTEKFWLADPEMLPKNMSNARILSYGYDASVTALFGRTSSNRILQHAHTLVAELVANRMLEGAMDRPIIFICHSLGGIVVKRVGDPARSIGCTLTRSRLLRILRAEPAS